MADRLAYRRSWPRHQTEWRTFVDAFELLAPPTRVPSRSAVSCCVSTSPPSCCSWCSHTNPGVKTTNNLMYWEKKGGKKRKKPGAEWMCSGCWMCTSSPSLCPSWTCFRGSKLRTTSCQWCLYGSSQVRTKVIKTTPDLSFFTHQTASLTSNVLTPSSD